MAKDSERDFFMQAPEAVEYGLIDEVVTKREDGKPKSKARSTSHEGG